MVWVGLWLRWVGWVLVGWICDCFGLGFGVKFCCFGFVGGFGGCVVGGCLWIWFGLGLVFELWWVVFWFVGLCGVFRLHFGLGDLSDLWVGCVFMDLFRVGCLVWVLYVLLLVCLFFVGGFGWFWVWVCYCFDFIVFL